MTIAPTGQRPLPALPPGLPPRVPVAVTLGAGLLLIVGTVSDWSPLTSAALAIGGAAVLPAVALVRRGWAIRTAARSVGALRGACRCSGMLGLGVLTTALTCVALPLTAPTYRPTVATAGLAVAASLFMLGLLHVPGLAFSAAGRLRQGLDGLIVGTSLGLVGWLLLPGFGAEQPLAYLAGTVAVSCAAIAAAAVLRAPRNRPAAVRCAGGAVLAIVGLALLVVTVGRDAGQWLLLAAAAAAIAGPPLIWAGARSVPPAAPSALRARLDDVFGGYPTLAPPVGAMVLAFGYHLATADSVDRTAVLLGALVGGLLALREVPNATDMRRYAQELAAQRAHLRALVTGANDVTVVLGEDLVVRWLSPAAGRQFGLTEPDVIGRRFLDLVHPDDAAAVADWLRRVADSEPLPGDPAPSLLAARIRDGLGYWRDTESTVSDLRHLPAVGALVLQLRDIGRRRALERTVHRLTCCDQLTGLPNRRELLRAITTRRQAGRCTGTLLVIDLAGFCTVNDLRGRAAGDALLLVAAQRLRTLVGQDDVVSRLGERQFAVVTADGPIEAYALGCRVVAELGKEYLLPDRRTAQLVASVGLTALTAGDNAEEVLRRADVAVGRACELGQTRVDWYDESLEHHLVRRLDIDRHLPGAAGRGELDLLYQPVIELASGRPVGVEALLRWRHPVLGTVLPGELLPAVDRLRLGAEVGDWSLHTACRQVAAWRRRGYDLWLAVNVTARQLAAADFVPEVAAALSVHQNPPERLTVEVPEAEVAEALPMVASQLSRLRALGVRTGLDGVGTGATDLARLRRLPLDVVKLSVPGGGGATEAAGESAGEVAAAVVDVARRLGATVVADELGTAQQRDLVQAAGVRYGQGGALAAPSPAERIEAYLAHHPAVAH